jgi:Zn-dependent M28 family amino/carboxypeptidase
MIDQVETEDIVRYTGDLSGEWPAIIGGEPYTIVSRNSFSGEPIRKAAQYLYEFYQGLGLEVSYHNFQLDEVALQNVVAQITGRAAPEKIFLITSHYDSNPHTPPAPGADDNASGTVAVMLAAEILSQYEFGCTLRFVNFAGEEQGLHGSKAYARDAYCSGEEIQGVLNLDMIAWNTAGSLPDMELHASSHAPGSLELATLYTETVASYGLDLIPEVIPDGTSASDHAAFWKYRLPAILAIEDIDDFNPNYHSSTDQVDNLEDLGYFTRMVQASLATFAHMSCLVEDGWGSLNGIVTDDNTGLTVPNALISLENQAWGITLSTLSDGGGRFYRALPAGEYRLTADALGYAPRSLPAVVVSPDAAVAAYPALLPAREAIHYLPLVQVEPAESANVCP